MSQGETESDSGNKKPPTSPIRGNTLRVYLLLLRQGPSELREVQRGLALSTPSLASYHLDKLIAAKYCYQNERGQYCPVREASGEVLDGYSSVGARLIPQLFFFTVLFTPVIGYFAIMSLYNPAYVEFLVVGSASLLVVLWYQTIKVWRRLSSIS